MRVTTIPIQQDCDTIVEDGTTPGCASVKQRWHPDSVIKNRGEPTVSADGEFDYSSCGRDIGLIGDPLDGSDPEVRDVITCPKCSKPRSGAVRMRVTDDDGNIRTCMFVEPAPRCWTVCGESPITEDPLNAGAGDVDDTVSLPINAMAEVKAGCFPLKVRARVTLCGFRPGNVDQSRQVSITIPGQDGGQSSTATDTISFSIPANISYTADITSTITDADGETEDGAESSCAWPGGTIDGGEWTVEPGTTLKVNAQGGIIYNADHSASFTYYPGQLKICLEVFEDTSQYDDSEAC